MYVAIAAHDLYPDPGSGGSGRYVYETARRMASRGHRVAVLTRRRGDRPHRDVLDGIDVYRYDIEVAGESAPSIARQIPDVIEQVRDHATAMTRGEQPDVLSFQGPLTSLLLDRTLDDAIPRVTTFHSPWPTEYAIKTRDASGLAALRRRLNVTIRHGLEGHVITASDAIVTLSTYMRDQLGRVYEPPVPATVIPGGVDGEQFGPDAGVYDPIAGIDGTTFLTVRRLSERMGHETLLEAFARVLTSHPDATLFVAGDGPLRERLERRAVDLGVADRTTFLGYVPDADLPAAHATADVFVLPTQTLEGFGLATLEALASATPAVATPVGGTVDVLDGLDGQLPAPTLVAGKSPAALATGMEKWASLDAAALERAGEQCRAYACDEFDWADTVDRLLAEYERLLESPRKASQAAD